MIITRTYWACPNPLHLQERFRRHKDRPIRAMQSAKHAVEACYRCVRRLINADALCSGCRVVKIEQGRARHDLTNWFDKRVWYEVWATFDGDKVPGQRHQPFQFSPLAEEVPLTDFGTAQAELAKGNYELGWKLYEWRFETAQGVLQSNPMGCPMWDGKAKPNRLLVHNDQGHGDTFQFFRYVKLLTCPFDLEVPMEAVRLFRANLPDEVRVSGVMEDGIYDYHLPICSLPLALKIDVTAYPNAPYIKAEPRDMGDGFKAGICWGGNPGHANNAARSVTLEHLLRFVPDDARVFSLQKGDYRDQLKHCPREITDLSSAADWLETAQIIAGLDLVVSIDTAVAHLAGAMGKPVWMILAGSNDWRWFNGTVWYPSMRIIRGNDPAPQLPGLPRLKSRSVLHDGRHASGQWPAGLA